MPPTAFAGRMAEATVSEVYMDLCPDSATLHVMQLARQALPKGLQVAEKRGATEDVPSIPSLMIRNVPTLYTPEELRSDLRTLGMCGGRDFDFLYLPLNAKKRRRNRGDVQGFEANWKHFAHIFLAFGRMRSCDGPVFWKEGKELWAKWDDIARLRKEATLGSGTVAWAVASLRFCVMCGKARRSSGRFCSECGCDLVAYCTKTYFQAPCATRHFEQVQRTSQQYYCL
eukprot:GEMP01088102.1.p1 GENE.GEMP01088102.1~~GEMP01088102.1.p1  ORF type:complete len:228 (+),score=42.46 GEMP01088102.1:116-799(+)